MKQLSALVCLFCICSFVISCGKTTLQPLPTDLHEQLLGPWLRTIPDSTVVDGYYFEDDGSLKLLNIFSMQADNWSQEGDRLTITTHTDRYPIPHPEEYIIDSISKDTLHLRTNGYQTIYRRPRYITERTNTRWVILYLPVATLEVQSDQEPFLQFTSADQLRGFGGCNRFNGSYLAGEDKLTVGPLLTTRMYCPNMGYEDAFLKSVSASRNYLMFEDQLYLFSGKVMQAAFKAMYY
jgi:heat shock protein HslJ